MVPTPTKSTTAVVMVFLVFVGDKQIARNRRCVFQQLIALLRHVHVNNILGSVFVIVLTVIYFWKRYLLIYGREWEYVPRSSKICFLGLIFVFMSIV